MLILQQAQCGEAARNGCHAETLAELQAHSAATGIPRGTHRQRLLEIARRLACVQALGDEYARVEFSPQMAALAGSLGPVSAEHEPA